jgi:hypothetical protein
MLKTLVGWPVVILLAVGESQAAKPQQSSNVSTPVTQYRATLDKYCVTCHNEKLKAAELLLDRLNLDNVPANAEAWEKVIRKLRGNAMPPPRLPRPDKSFYTDFPVYLETSIDRAAATNPNPGRPAVHRLNRAEYVNAVRDLLAVNIDGESLLPTDDSGYGFDNNGDVLTVSPTLLERYLSAARTVTRLAIGDRAMRPTIATYEVPRGLKQDDRMDEELPFGTRGGVAFRHNFPADGEYVVKIRLRRVGDLVNGDGGIVIGVALKRQLEVSLDTARVKLFSVGGEHFGKSGRGDGGGALVTYGLGDLFAGDPKQVEYEAYGADAGLEARFPVTAGPHSLGVAFRMEDDSLPEGVLKENPRFSFGGSKGQTKTSEPLIESVIIRGPFDAKGLGETPSRRKIFFCSPANAPVKLVSTRTANGANEEEICAGKIVSTLARRAYRRPVTDEDVQPLLGLYRRGQSKGGFEAGIQMALEGMLVSPKFLFRVERDPPNAKPGWAYHISDHELASRLSFFLWSSIPDDQLLSLAAQGKLSNREVLRQQVSRMLVDPRSKALVSNFTGQWLQLRHLSELSPDDKEFPDFDESLRQAFEQETELFLESMVREDRPLMELLDANYTFVNERLAKHYGIPNIYGSSFRRVTLTDENRRGLLGQGSILSLTSYPTRTSVVLRGVWLLTNILASPPPAPPGNVPVLKDRGNDGRIRSLRESMEEHRANPVCASCHLRMDPLGFALENFDGIGQWRTTEGRNRPIDSSAALPDGTTFKGPVELRKVLMSQPDQFATAVIEKLLTYAIGRGVEYFDEPAVRKIKQEAAPDYRWSSLIAGVINSEAFEMRRTREP